MSPIKINQILLGLSTSLIGFNYTFSALPARAEMTPKQVIDSVYTGIQKLHGYKKTPRLLWNVPKGSLGSCGRISGSLYCSRNHTVYITKQDIKMSYQYGDAALAYIVAHEYAHAMQIAFKFVPRSITKAELQADCLAGSYLGYIPNIEFDDKDILEITRFVRKIGDYDWGSKHHHGTPDQRVKALVIGMRSSINGKGISACRI
jgi:uncharacterized protein